MLHLYNSLSGKKEEFVPLEENKISLYVCGVTIYDFCHIGHARTYAAFDVLVRFLRWQKIAVTYVRNITDIDDKIINRAALRKLSVEQVVEQNIIEMYRDFDALNFLRPDKEPRATETLPEIIAMIALLIEKGFAYVAENGDVYYEVGRFKEYGKLSKQNLEALHAGNRVDINESKKSPLDFVLWKAAKPGEPAWNSPWGNGRPGWHIECSAMTKKCLGETFDIHGGGSDLRFPHHENEIAQSCAANSGPFARYWMHTGMVQVNNEKMSKSLGNFFVIRDVLKEYSAEVIRFFLISGHYRSEISYSTENLNSAKAALTRLYRALEGQTLYPYQGPAEYKERFIAALNDDLNTPEALAVLFEVARLINQYQHDSLHSGQFASLLKELGNILGILEKPPELFLQGDLHDLDVAKIEKLIAERKLARELKDFRRSDQIRDELKQMGVELEDTRMETLWRKI